jgi:hypothetical protein
VIKLKRWAGHMVWMEEMMRNIIQDKRPLGISRRRGRIILKCILKK